VNRAYRVGTANANPVMTDGTTNMKLYNMIMLIIPDLLSPTILITPNSKVFDSTLIISNEYMSKILRTINKIIITLKISPKNMMAYE
jgi:hypothetical protein